MSPKSLAITSLTAKSIIITRTARTLVWSIVDHPPNLFLGTLPSVRFFQVIDCFLLRAGVKHINRVIVNWTTPDRANAL